jgi:hypothetical protein
VKFNATQQSMLLMNNVMGLIVIVMDKLMKEIQVEDKLVKPLF